MTNPPDLADVGIPPAIDRPTARYRLDPRVEALVGSFAGAVLRGAQGDHLDVEDLALLLRDLEELVCRAREAEAGAIEMVERDGWPLFDAAGRAVVNAMKDVVVEELGEHEWCRLLTDRRAALCPTDDGGSSSSNPRP